jgi:GTP-binding protein
MPIPKISYAEFVLSALQESQFPRDGLPEVAFLGRSNVGKSTLINVLLGRRRLVRVSARPGCTRSLNFFLINRRWYFVDLPGFGYARVSRQLQSDWGRLILKYLDRRQTLAGVVFLQDSRRLPGPEELFLWENLLSRGRALIPVLTKADKLKQSERTRQLNKIATTLAPFGLDRGDFLWFSALTHEGRGKLWERILKAIVGGGPGGDPPALPPGAPPNPHTCKGLRVGPGAKG